MHYSSGPRVIPHPLPEMNFLMVEIPTLKPYIFMIRVTRQIKCLIALAPGGHTPPPTCCLVNLIINIYGLRVGSEPLKISLQEGVGYDPPGPELSDI
jgi:hypothetical protein